MNAPDLDTRIGTADVTYEHTRDGYGEGLKEAGADNSAVVALCADLTESTRTHHFAEAYPERFVQVGVAEQNMASVASGMAAMGKIPFITSYAMFSPGRSWEQVRTTIGYNESNVKIIGAHAGISVGPDGATHQAIEDIALMRVIPGMTVLAPADIHEARAMTKWAAEHKGPVYMRMGREKTAVVTTADTSCTVGKARPVYTPEDSTVAIVTTGTLLHNAYLAAQQLQTEGVIASVTHFGMIKPLDTDTLTWLAKTHEHIVTVEEHQVAGGFGSVVAEHLSEHHPIAVTRIGVHDQYGQSGTPEELLTHYGLDAAGIVTRIKNLYAKS